MDAALRALLRLHMTDVDTVETGEDSQTSIDELFDAEVETEAPAEVETEATGEVEKTTEVEQTESAPPADKEASAFKTAYLDEKRKRQELEERLAAIERTPEKVPDPVEDPEGFAAYQNNRLATTEYTIKANVSRTLMMELKPDYTELEAVFVEMAESDPSLIAKLHASDNPAKFAYETAMQHREVQKWMNPETRQKLIAEEAAKMAEEIARKLIAETTPKKSALSVPNLAKAPAAGSNTVEAESVPDLDALFADSPF